MKRTTILSLLIGSGLAVTLFASNDVAGIFDALLNAGWGILLVIGLHLPQIVFSTLGWGALMGSGARPSFWLLFRLRWVRESANALLPMAQIGGDFVRARLLAQRGTPLKNSVAFSMVDLSVEMTSQIVFTLFAVSLLLTTAHFSNAVPLAIATTLGSGLIAISFMASQRFGVFKLFEGAIARLAAGKKWAFLGKLSGLNEVVVGLYKQPRLIWKCGLQHLISWILGGLETWAAMRVLGLGPSLREAMIVEGLSQAVRGLAFFVPGALGVQEGGYLLICAMFGVSPQNALALSLIRRIRELTLGVPGLVVWYQFERQHSNGARAAIDPVIDPLPRNSELVTEEAEAR